MRSACWHQGNCVLVSCHLVSVLIAVLIVLLSPIYSSHTNLAPRDGSDLTILAHVRDLAIEQHDMIYFPQFLILTMISINPTKGNTDIVLHVKFHT